VEGGTLIKEWSWTTGCVEPDTLNRLYEHVCIEINTFTYQACETYKDLSHFFHTQHGVAKGDKLSSVLAYTALVHVGGIH
jgi:hypothetical protein